MRAGVLTAAERRTSISQSLGSCGVTSLVRMPRLLAVVTEQSSTSWTLARQLRTTGAAGRYHHVPAVHKMNISPSAFCYLQHCISPLTQAAYIIITVINRSKQN